MRTILLSILRKNTQRYMGYKLQKGWAALQEGY
jgi:hypothetical protein